VRNLLAALLLLVAAPAAVAAEPAKLARTPPSDAIDVVYFASRGPLRLRFLLAESGRPFELPWRAYTDKVFAFHDRNSDRFLDAKEMSRLAAFPFRGRPGPQVGPGGMPAPADLPLDRLDGDKDGKVSPDELAAWLKATGNGPVSVAIRSPENQLQQLTDALFKCLDTDKDGRLTQEECAAAPGRLDALDSDEDEIISTAELLNKGPANPYLALPLTAAAHGGVDPAGDFLPSPAGSPDAGKAVIARRDKDKDGYLTRAELGCPTEAFAALDTDGDGKWSASEADAWLGGSPDLVWIARQGDLSNTGIGWAFKAIGATAPPGLLTPVEALPSPLKALTTPIDGGVRLDLTDAVVTLKAGPGQPQGGIRFVNNAGFNRQQFQQAAGEKKFVEKKDLKGNPNLAFALNLFDAADRDADGKLTLTELDEILGLIGRGEQLQAVLTVTDQGLDLFGLIDADRDRRLGVRELRGVWERIKGCDRDEDGKLARQELPRQFPVFVERGPVTAANNTGQFVVALATEGMSGLPAVTRGPHWFQKMDRNRDGDVSAKEFLGSLDRFRELDADGDGLISLSEATKAAAR
jgi:Ca2+-binding EF-hand superfamily protein